MRFAPILGLPVLLLVGCTSVAGAGIVAAVAGAAVLASDCSDFIDITVRDGQTGARTCDAIVTAVRAGDEAEQLMPCYHARLGEGTWQIRATLPGGGEATSSIKIERPSECGRTVQSIELWLTQPGTSIATPPQGTAPAPPPPSPPLPAPPPAPSPAAPAPAGPPSPSTAAPPADPAALPPKTAPVKRFPDAVDGGR